MSHLILVQSSIRTGACRRPLCTVLLTLLSESPRAAACLTAERLVDCWMDALTHAAFSGTVMVEGRSQTVSSSVQNPLLLSNYLERNRVGQVGTGNKSKYTAIDRYHVSKVGVIFKYGRFVCRTRYIENKSGESFSKSVYDRFATLPHHYTHRSSLNELRGRTVSVSEGGGGGQIFVSFSRLTMCSLRGPRESSPRDTIIRRPRDEITEKYDRRTCGPIVQYDIFLFVARPDILPKLTAPGWRILFTIV